MWNPRMHINLGKTYASVITDLESQNPCSLRYESTKEEILTENEIEGWGLKYWCFPLTATLSQNYGRHFCCPSLLQELE